MIVLLVVRADLAGKALNSLKSLEVFLTYVLSNCRVKHTLLITIVTDKFASLLSYVRFVFR